MKLLNKKFLEFRFTVPKIKIDTDIITLSYFKTWQDVFMIRKSHIALHLKHMGGIDYTLSYETFVTNLLQGDVIMLQVCKYGDTLFVIVNPPIYTDKLDSDTYTDVYADIWKKVDFPWLCWLNCRFNLNDVGTNFM